MDVCIVQLENVFSCPFSSPSRVYNRSLRDSKNSFWREISSNGWIYFSLHYRVISEPIDSVCRLFPKPVIVLGGVEITLYISSHFWKGIEPFWPMPGDVLDVTNPPPPPTPPDKDTMAHFKDYKFFRSFSTKVEGWPMRKAEQLWRKMRERKIAGIYLLKK